MKINNLLKILLLCLGLAFLIVYLEPVYVGEIILNQLPAIFITVLGFSQAGIMFLLSSLGNYEIKNGGKKRFTGTRRELHDAMKFQVLSFLSALIFTVIISRCNVFYIDQFFSVVVITLFLMNIYSMYSIVTLGVDFIENN